MMMTYEQWLERRRINPEDKEVLRVGQLKTIRDAEAQARHLRAWLADRVTLHVITRTEDAHEAARTLARRDVLALDIETAKTDPSHPQAGLHPKLSRIRLIQYCDGRDCYLFDQYRIGTLDWIRRLTAVKTIAHNARFEASHFLHQGIVFDALHDTMLMGRVFQNENKSLKDLAAEALDLTLDKTLQVSDWKRPDLFAEQLEYGAADAVVAFELAKIFEQWFSENGPHYCAFWRT